MKNCSFQSMLMISQIERSARKVKFDPKITIIRGENDMGKSSLMKTIYQTFAATPAKMHPKWIAAEVKSLVRFTLDGTAFAVLKNGSMHTVFDSEGRVIFSGSSVTKEIGPFFADMFNFRLELQSKSGTETQATPAFLFLPFYMDQDASWSNNWSSFSNLTQFARWRQDVAEYHMGVRPNEFYQAKSGLLKIRTALKEQQDRREMLQKVLKNLKDEISESDFNIDIDEYRNEIEQLLIVCNKLKEKEDILKRELTALYNGKISIEAQIGITAAAAREMHNDYQFAVHKVPDEIECPTCGTEHVNSFSERFEIAKDEQRCNELLIELRSHLSICDSGISKLKEKYSGVSAELTEAREILNRKQGAVTLQHIIQDQGKKEAQKAISKTINRINEEIGRIDGDIEALEKKMKRYEDREHRKEIRTKYVSSMGRALSEVEVRNLPEKSYSKFDSKISESGSDLPRALIAYYFSVLGRIFENPSATVFPIVIDSPKDKDQDRPNWTKMLQFIRAHRPKNAQIILALVDDEGVDMGGRVVEFKNKDSVLAESEYGAVSAEILPFINASLQAD